MFVVRLRDDRRACATSARQAYPIRRIHRGVQLSLSGDARTAASNSSRTTSRRLARRDTAGRPVSQAEGRACGVVSPSHGGRLSRLTRGSISSTSEQVVRKLRVHLLVRTMRNAVHGDQCIDSRESDRARHRASARNLAASPLQLYDQPARSHAGRLRSAGVTSGFGQCSSADCCGRQQVDAVLQFVYDDRRNPTALVVSKRTQ